MCAVTEISISLPPELLRFITARIESGRYNSSSAVVSDALRLLELAESDQASATERLGQAWSEGVATADAGVMDIEALKAEARKRLATTG